MSYSLQLEDLYREITVLERTNGYLRKQIRELEEENSRLRKDINNQQELFNLKEDQLLDIIKQNGIKL